jgi:hypothetical protein
MSFEEYNDFLANTEGLLLFYCEHTETVHLQPPDHRHGCHPRFLRGAMHGGIGEAELTATEIIIDTRNVQVDDPIIIPNVVLVMVRDSHNLGIGM